MNTPSNNWMNETLPKWEGKSKFKKKHKQTYDPKKHSWKAILTKKTKAIRKRKVIFSSDQGHASLVGFKPAKIKSMSYQEYAKRKTAQDGIDRGF